MILNRAGDELIFNIPFNGEYELKIQHQNRVIYQIAIENHPNSLPQFKNNLIPNDACHSKDIIVLLDVSPSALNNQQINYNILLSKLNDCSYINKLDVCTFADELHPHKIESYDKGKVEDLLYSINSNKNNYIDTDLNFTMSYLLDSIVQYDEVIIISDFWPSKSNGNRPKGWYRSIFEFISILQEIKSKDTEVRLFYAGNYDKHNLLEFLKWDEKIISADQSIPEFIYDAEKAFYRCNSTNQFGISLYPNPVENTLQVKIPESIDNNSVLEARIYGVNGNLIGLYPISSGSTNQLHIDYPPGIYSFQVFQGSNLVYSNRFIKQ